jgi:hypothetical protein
MWKKFQQRPMADAYQEAGGNANCPWGGGAATSNLLGILDGQPLLVQGALRDGPRSRPMCGLIDFYCAMHGPRVCFGSSGRSGWGEGCGARGGSPRTFDQREKGPVPDGGRYPKAAPRAPADASPTTRRVCGPYGMLRHGAWPGRSTLGQQRARRRGGRRKRRARPWFGRSKDALRRGQREGWIDAVEGSSRAAERKSSAARGSPASRFGDRASSNNNSTAARAVQGPFWVRLGTLGSRGLDAVGPIPRPLSLSASCC